MSTSPPLPRRSLFLPQGVLNAARLHPRLFIAAVIGVGSGLAMPGAWRSLVRMLLGWDVAATIYLVLTALMISRSTYEGMRRRAAIQDESGWTILVVSAAAAAVSLGSIFGLLSGFKDLAGAAKIGTLVLGIYTILCSWFFLHTLFTLHYAHEHYGAPDDDGDDDGARGGLQFSGGDPTPGYVDFAYFSFTIGMAAQTSDTCVTSPTMRGLTLTHGILSFFFNTVILALTINIMASLF